MELEIGDGILRRDGDEVEVFLAGCYGLGLTDIRESTNARITSLRVGREAEGGLALHQ